MRTVHAVNPVRNSITRNNRVHKGQISNGVKYEQFFERVENVKEKGGRNDVSFGWFSL